MEHLRGPAIERSTLILDYHSIVHFNIMDDFKHPDQPIFLDKSLLPFPGLTRLALTPLVHKTTRYFQVDCSFEFKIRRDKKEYISLKKTIDGNPPDSDYQMVLYARKKECESIVKNIMEYLIWRKKIFINPPFLQVIETRSCTWVLDGVSGSFETKEQWYPAGDDFVNVEVSDKDFSPVDFEDFRALLERKESMPLHHELLQEAYRLIGTETYRGAFLTLFTALEVGTKALVAKEHAELDWIINNTQAPSLEVIYRDYINVGGRFLIEDPEFEMIGNMTTTRNRIAHQGAEVSRDQFRKYRNFVRSILYKIDFQMGYSWAETEEESNWYSDKYINFTLIDV